MNRSSSRELWASSALSAQWGYMRMNAVFLHLWMRQPWRFSHLLANGLIRIWGQISLAFFLSETQDSARDMKLFNWLGMENLNLKIGTLTSGHLVRSWEVKATLWVSHTERPDLKNYFY